MIENIKEILKDEKFLEGVLFILFIMTGKFLIDEVQENLKIICKNKLIKYIILYTISFVAVHDYKIAGLLTILSIFIFDFLLNPKSSVSILKFKKSDDDEEKDKLPLIPMRPAHTSGDFGHTIKSLPSEQETQEKLPEIDELSPLEKFFV